MKQFSIGQVRSNLRISVVIPTLNEADNLPFVMSTLSEGDYEIIVVDGRSTDDTERVASALCPGVTIIREATPGKGAALQAGFAAATGDIIVMLDADGSADGREIPRFVDALTGGADFAKGSRFVGGGGSADITAIRNSGNRALTQLVNLMFGASFTDLCYGYNAFWRRCLPYLNVDCDGFEVETLITVRALRSGLRITEVPSYESNRIHGHSNLHAVRDGRRVLSTILKEARTPPPLTIVGEGHDGTSSASARPRVCVVGPGGHAPVHGAVTNHLVRELLAFADVSAIDLAVPDDPLDRTLLGTTTPSLSAVPSVSASASPISALRRRRVRRFFVREQPSVVVLEWWTEGQLGHFRDIAASAQQVGAAVVLRCCGSLMLESSLGRHALRRVLEHVDLVITQGHTPALLSPGTSRVVDIRELRTAERRFDPTHLHAVAFLPHDGLEAAREVLDAISALSEKRAIGYRFELLWSNERERPALERLIADHHHSDKLSISSINMSDVELERRMEHVDVAILIDPAADSRAYGAVEHNGVPVVIAATNVSTGIDNYPGAVRCPLDSSSVLAALERSNLARRYHYPSADRWMVGVARLLETICSLDAVERPEGPVAATAVERALRIVARAG